MTRQIKLALRLHEVLRAIYAYIEEYGSPPYHNNQWIIEKTGYGSNHITNIKNELKKLRYVDDDLNLTESGKNYIRYFFGPFVVRGAEVRVQGKVRAGLEENVLVDFDAFDTPSEEIESIPSTSEDHDTFALKVIGLSMKELGILPGDLVIVERQDKLWWPDQQDVIIAKYIPYVSKRRSSGEPDPASFVGPVIKVYLKRFGEKGGELGWRRSLSETGLNVIRADILEPIGKVVGVYRDIKYLHR